MPTPEEEDGAGETAAASVAAKSQAATPQGSLLSIGVNCKTRTLFHWE